ncbi:class I SAM-dependent methyltransferase [Saliphagus infecundisoli]|uniref:Class I SAM-dependent methyltransferase n=1 Tax=Saliphagus infecundisoli TaxID=1849069 RepID=A0ABD5QFM5_9EURY|nr:class I SAM-dependent methyltransferase [Saliphagus infecundisoli]
MREFSAEYLRRTREGMWDDRAALAPLRLESRESVLDVGCGTGELSRVIVEESPGTVVGCDVDRDLLATAREHVSVVAGDALRLPFPDDSFDLVVCQALLINLPEPAAALSEFARVSRELVAAIEPDNAQVRVESSVASESALSARAREAYVEGVETDVSLGADARELFAEAALEVLESRRYDHERRIEPPYGEAALADARRKATGAGLESDRATLLSGPMDEEDYDELRGEWREMGREVIDRMGDGAYRRREVVPFHVTVGRVAGASPGE